MNIALLQIELDASSPAGNLQRVLAAIARVAKADPPPDLLVLPGIEPIEPDANFVLCRLTDSSADGPEIAQRLYIEHNILIKDCASKSMPDADRYLRIASRTPAENRELVEALAAVLSSVRAGSGG